MGSSQGSVDTPKAGHEQYVQGFLPKKMLVALSEDQASGTSSQAQGACQQAAVRRWRQRGDARLLWESKWQK